MTTTNSLNAPIPFAVTKGGTGVATLTTAYGVLCAGTVATGNVQTLSSLGTSGQVLTSGGAGALPGWTTPSGAGNPNLLVNGNFQAAQRTGSYGSVSVPASTSAFTLDRWNLVTSPSNSYTVGQNLYGTTFNTDICVQIQRDAGQTGTGTIYFGQTVYPQMFQGVAGNVVSLSFQVRKGANYSAASNTLVYAVITGTDSGPTNGVKAGGTNFAGFSNIGSSTATLTGAWQTITLNNLSVASTATECSVIFESAPSGTAGANDWYELANVKLEISPVATPFLPLSYIDTITQCLPYFCSSFSTATSPAQMVGINAGEAIIVASKAAALTNYSTFIPFPTSMLSPPNVVMTLYNPGNTNADAYDEVAAADCSSTTVTALNVNGFAISTVGNAATVVGNPLGINWSADFDSNYL